MQVEKNITAKRWQPPKEVLDENKQFLSSIGKELKVLRERKGVSIVKLSNELKISRNSYSQMEKGEVYFSVENFLKILHYHKISPIKFFRKLKEG